MSKTTLDSDLYGDIYGDEDNEFAVPLTEDTNQDHDGLLLELEDIEEADGNTSPKEQVTTSAQPSTQETQHSLPAKPNAAASTSTLSYSAQIAKQFSAYQQTPSQERQQRAENSLPLNPRTTMNQRPQSITTHTSSDTVFGKKPSEMHDAGKMFVGGLNWDTTDEGLRDYFSRFGKVDACTIMRDPSGTSRGFAFLTFEDPSSVDVVVAQQHELDGKSIDPKRAIPREEHLRNTRYFVGGLAPNSTPDSMREFFSAYGKVVDATVMLDRETGRSKGFGFVTFEDANNADQLVGKIGLTLDDKQIEVKMAQPRSQRDQGRGMQNTNTSTSTETFENRTLALPMTSNVVPMSTPQNAMSMMYQRPMAPMQMMNMNPMMGMGFGMNAFNSMGPMMPVGPNTMMNNNMNSFPNMNAMANMGPMRIGMGPIGNFSGMSGPIGMMNGSMNSIGGQGGMNMRPGVVMLGQQVRRAVGNSGPGPTRLSARGQHGFHPYAR